jgi:hypothetical protein
MMRATKLKVVAAAVTVLAAVLLFWQGKTIRDLLDENAALRDRATARLPSGDAQTTASKPGQDELERLRNEHVELLRLRGEVGLLRRQSKEISVKTAKAIPPPRSEESRPVFKVTTNLANVRATIAPGQTLVAGGWASSTQKRVLVFVSPEVSDDGSVQIGSQFVEMPENLLAVLGLDGMKAGSSESSAQQILSREQNAALMKTLVETEGVDVLSTPTVTTANGPQAQVQAVNLKSVGDQTYTLGPMVDLIPRVAADRSSIDLSIIARLHQEARPGADE